MTKTPQQIRNEVEKEMKKKVVTNSKDLLVKIELAKEGDEIVFLENGKKIGSLNDAIHNYSQQQLSVGSLQKGITDKCPNQLNSEKGTSAKYIFTVDFCVDECAYTTEKIFKREIDADRFAVKFRNSLQIGSRDVKVRKRLLE